MERRAAERHTIESFIAPLFVPGDRTDRAASTLVRGTRCLVLDLEDSVAAAQKPVARDLVATFLGSVSTTAAISVRVNSETEALGHDLSALGPHLVMLNVLVLAKAESPEQVAHLMGLMEAAEARRDVPGRPPWIIPTIETAAGVEAAPAIAAAPGVMTLLFGSADLAADLGTSVSADGLELLMARSRVVHACAIAKISGPIDGAHLVLDDVPGLETSARHARRLGFAGKVAIHPQQLAMVRQVFSPDVAQIEWASRVVEAHDRSLAMGVGALRLDDGTFIDEPIARRARAILRRASILRDPGGDV